MAPRPMPDTGFFMAAGYIVALPLEDDCCQDQHSSAARPLDLAIVEKAMLSVRQLLKPKHGHEPPLEHLVVKSWRKSSSHGIDNFFVKIAKGL